MAYKIKWAMEVVWVGDGCGAMSVSSAQQLTMLSKQYAGAVPVQGGDAPTQANFNSAITGAMTTNMEAAIAANLTQLQGFATAGG
jgi:hypothetical protein